MRRAVVALVMVAVVGLFAWAGVRNYRNRVEAMRAARLNQATLVKDMDITPDAAGSALRGKPAPSFTLTDIAGKKLSLADLQGHPVVLNFWATWCGPCKLEMPWFEQLSAQYKGQGLIIVGLDQDEGAKSPEIAAAARKIGVTYPILLPDDAVAKAYGGVDFLPETFYLDKNGVVVEATAGAHPKDEIEANVRKAMGASGL